MSEYKEVKRTEVPSYHQLPTMVINLRKKYKKSFRIDIEVWSFDGDSHLSIPSFAISAVPGFDNEKCVINRFSTWPEIQEYYFQLMDKEI